MYWAWPPSAVEGNDKLPGQLRGDIDAKVMSDDMKTEIDAGRTAGRGEDSPILYVECPGVDIDVARLAGKAVSIGPMRGRPAAA